MKDLETQKDQFTTELRSRLRTQITTIKLQVAALMNQRLGSLNEKQNALLQIANESIDHLAAILDNTSDMTGIQAHRIKLNRQRASLRHIIKLAIDYYQDIAGGRTLTINCPQDANVFVDPERLARVLGNLLEMAVKCTREDGTIQIAAVTTKDNVTIQLEADGIQMVEDTAAGQPDDNSGLAYNRQVIESQQGTLSPPPEPGQSFHYTVTLPFYQFEFALQESFRELVELMEQHGDGVAVIALNCRNIIQNKTLTELLSIVRSNIYKNDVALEAPPHSLVVLSLANAQGARAIFLRMKKMLDTSILGGIQIYPTDGMDIYRLLSQATDQADSNIPS